MKTVDSRRIRALAIAMLPVFVAALAGCGQRSSQVATLTVERIATLGVTNDSGYVGLPSGLARGDDSEWFLTQYNAPDAVYVFDSAGHYLRRIGRRGTGPGEFVSTRGILRTADALHVFDQRLLRRTRVTTDGEFIDAAPVPGQILEAAPLDAEALVINTIPRGAGIGHRVLAIMDGTGALTVTFGDTVDEVNIDPNRYWRKIAVAGNGTIWTAHLTEYRLDEWSGSGEHLRTIQPPAAWFEPHDGSGLHELVPSGPVIHAIQADAHGRIWVLVHVPDTNRASAFDADPNAPGEQRFSGDYSALWDTRIDVIDLATEQLLAQATVPEYLAGFADAGIAYSYSLQTDARPRIDVFALSSPW
jgi:hypothetical protein